MSALLKRPSVLYAGVAALLTGILVAMVHARVQHLRHGREIVLNIRPVDPRDLFKGDYVQLGFDITAVPSAHLKAVPFRARAFVLLEPGAAEGDWTIVSVTAVRPAAGGRQIVLAAKSAGNFLRYGIERYYVPEGHGPKLEADARSGKLAAIVAVDAGGVAAIKGLKLDGRTIHREPLL